MTEEELLALASDLERNDPEGWTQRVRNIPGDFVFLRERPEMAVPLRYLEHILDNGPRGKGPTGTAPGVMRALKQDLLNAGYDPITSSDAGFTKAFSRYLAYYVALSESAGPGNPASRETYRAQMVFWLPRAEASGATFSSVMAAMEKIAEGFVPDGFGVARVWFVRHPATGMFFPAKQVWGLATDQTGKDFNAHQARDGLRKLGFSVPGPDEPASEIGVSPENLVRLPLRFEGAERQVTRNIRERDSGARRDAEAYWRKQYGGTLCCRACGIDFGLMYGPRGEGYMHFHHLVQLSSSQGARETDPVRDLVPVCPNCHAIIHRGEVMITPEDLAVLIVRNHR